MKTSLLWILSTGFLLLTMTACTPSGGGSDGTPDSVRPLFLGDLDKKIGEIYSKENEIIFDPCDFKNRDRIVEVAKALEQKRTEISDFIKSQPVSPNQTLIDFGNFKFIDDLNAKIGENKWESDIWGWPEIISYYDQIKNWPVDKNWVFLNRSVRGVISDDESRIVDLSFYSLSRDAGPKLDGIQARVQVCVENEACIDPKLSLEQKNFLNTNWLFNFYNEALASDRYSQTKKREYLAKFLKRIKRENDWYLFHANPIARVEGNTLVIPMDLSILGEGAPRFIGLIEKAWNIDGEKSIKIEVKSRPVASFLLKVDEILGGRASVSFEDGGYMQLFNFSRLKTATHEFGHVIGLTDEYYTTWDTSKCGYSTEGNPGNIMSGSSTGKVLPEHWQAIKKNYWKQ